MTQDIDLSKNGPTSRCHPPCSPSPAIISVASSRGWGFCCSEFWSLSA